MEIEIKRITSWERVLNACRMTVNKKYLAKEPGDEFKRKLVMSEHSPLRMLEFDITISDLPYWIHAELCRHHIGVEKFVTTSRPDRTHSGLTRYELPQDALISMTLSMNAQAIINVSRMRLCRKAADETQAVWNAVISKLREVEPILADACVPNCIYRGFCPEIEPCGYSQTRHYIYRLERYRKNEVPL